MLFIIIALAVTVWRSKREEIGTGTQEGTAECSWRKLDGI